MKGACPKALKKSLVRSQWMFQIMHSETNSSWLDLQLSGDIEEKSIEYQNSVVTIIHSGATYYFYKAC